MDLSETDEPARYIGLEAAQWFYDATETAPSTPEDLIATAQVFEAYLSAGESVEYHCNPDLRHCVTGRKC